MRLLKKDCLMIAAWKKKEKGNKNEKTNSRIKRLGKWKYPLELSIKDVTHLGGREDLPKSDVTP